MGGATKRRHHLASTLLYPVPQPPAFPATAAFRAPSAPTSSNVLVWYGADAEEI